MCENFRGIGVSLHGGFGEYVALYVLPRTACISALQWLKSTISKAEKVFKIHNLTDEEATLVEPAACAVHGMDKLGPTVGLDALIIGAGPTGLILAQLLKLNGAHRVVIAANKGIKLDLAKQLAAGDEYIELDRENPAPQWEELKQKNPYGFDVVVSSQRCFEELDQIWGLTTDVVLQVEATGSEKVANDAINYVRRAGTLMIYGVYNNDALIHWPPFKIFVDEIRVRTSFLLARTATSEGTESRT